MSIGTSWDSRTMRRPTLSAPLRGDYRGQYNSSGYRDFFPNLCSLSSSFSEYVRPSYTTQFPSINSRSQPIEYVPPAPSSVAVQHQLLEGTRDIPPPAGRLATPSAQGLLRTLMTLITLISGKFDFVFIQVFHSSPGVVLFT